ncbi:hypothetical protein CTH30272_03088 [Allocatenococcus thiocycli]|nr:hypothetical protein CTH30272_03088 [Catenococcus thiocycli]
MAIIRINKAEEGAAEYLVNGKASMGMHRDEYDRRVHLGGDNNTLLDATNFIKENKGWESSYRHFTLSFSADEHKDLLSMPLEKRQQKMAQMCQLMLQKYFPHRDPADLIYQAEAHEPIGNHKAYSVRTKKMEARLLHIHLIVSNLDPVTQNKLEQISSNEDVLNAIQSDICTTFNLHDPAFVANIQGPKKGLSLGDKLAKVIVQNRVESPSELKSALIDSGLVDDISVRFSKKNGVYAVAAINKNQRYKNGKVVNLRGERFDELLKPIYDKYYDLFQNAHKDDRSAIKASFFDITEKESIYDPATEKALRDKLIKKYNKKHILSLTQIGRFQIASDYKLREEIYTDAKSKFIDDESVVFDEKSETYRQQKRLSRQQDFEEFQEFKQSYKGSSKYGQTFEELTRSQRNFFAVYRTNINQSIIKDTKVFDDRYDPRTKVIHSKELALTILDHADEDCLSMRSYQKVNDKDSAIRLMLETAQAKGWALEDIDISGTDDFKENVERVRAQMAQEKVEKIASTLNIQESSFSSLTNESDWLVASKSYGVCSGTFGTETRARARINRRNKGNIHNKDILKRVKENLNEDRVKRLIVSTKLNININNLQFSRNSKDHVVIQVEGESSKALNVVDFLLKKQGMSLDKVVDLSKRELQKSKEVTPDELRQILTPPFEKAEKSQKNIYLDGLRKLHKDKPAKERDQAIISKILYDITVNEIVKPVAQTGKTDESKKKFTTNLSKH